MQKTAKSYSALENLFSFSRHSSANFKHFCSHWINMTCLIIQAPEPENCLAGKTTPNAL
jgi:hypothetical protein